MTLLHYNAYFFAGSLIRGFLPPPPPLLFLAPPLPPLSPPPPPPPVMFLAPLFRERLGRASVKGPIVQEHSFLRSASNHIRSFARRPITFVPSLDARLHRELRGKYTRVILHTHTSQAPWVVRDVRWTNVKALRSGVSKLRDRLTHGLKGVNFQIVKGVNYVWFQMCLSNSTFFFDSHHYIACGA